MAPLSERDPVCGMDVDPMLTSHHATYRAHTYHFCSATCLHEFEEHPDTYTTE